MSGKGAAQLDRLRPFPAIDPEPPPRSRRYRLVATAIAVGVASALAAAGLLLAGGPTSQTAGAPIPALARTGSILAMDTAGAVLSTDSGGRAVRKLSVLGRFPQAGLPGLSPDGRFVTFGNGDVLSVAGAAPRRAAAKLSLASDQILASPDALGDHDRSAAVLKEGMFGGPTSTAKVSVVNISTGATTPLGIADSAAADPQQPGAFVSVAAPPEPTAAVLISGDSDGRVELRDAGHAPVLLATSADLNRALGQDPTTPVTLRPLPDPAGDMVAVEVRSLIKGGPDSEGVVFLNRTGQVEATVSFGLGPEAGAEPRWSPDGLQLVWVSTGPDITVYSLGGGTLTRPAPRSGFGARCLWSPSGAAVLCDIEKALPKPSRTWAVAAAHGGPVVVVPAPGFPLAWFGGGPRS